MMPTIHHRQFADLVGPHEVKCGADPAANRYGNGIAGHDFANRPINGRVVLALKELGEIAIGEESANAFVFIDEHHGAGAPAGMATTNINLTHGHVGRSNAKVMSAAHQ